VAGEFGYRGVGQIIGESGEKTVWLKKSHEERGGLFGSDGGGPSAGISLAEDVNNRVWGKLGGAG